MGKPIIFLGPSLSHEKARKIFDADYRPPARKGDFLRLAADFDVVEMAIGFVDGVFLQDYPPTPIEVYHLARKNGVLLVGAASLGALRAVELEKFGMVGIGKIFQLYKTGKVNADDEVAVTFASEGDYQLQSEAMIDIRYNLYLAHKKGVINEKAKSMLVRLAKEIYFPHRKYTYILEEARNRYPMLESEINSFGSYIRSNRKSLKEMDAIRLVKYLKEHYESTNAISTR
ncbi:MAG: putative TfuA domain protein core [Nitrososphaera sp.]|jgi:TfuA protein|nr:putative TfuA domain protein core [Nitrososphaera sp.]MCY1155086.1 putative TfuA domain protein core [Nitrososphaera sp.]MDP9462192.1 TfuA-like protein [Thermoproteota archaeon]MDW0140314.1 TfuA-like protein [Nitrososphaeraceae archaeon]